LKKDARRGDAAAAERLKEWLEFKPWVLDEVDSLADRVVAAWVKAAAFNDHVVMAALEREVGRLRAELSAAGASPLEALLAEAAAVSQRRDRAPTYLSRRWCGLGRWRPGDRHGRIDPSYRPRPRVSRTCDPDRPKLRATSVRPRSGHRPARVGPSHPRPPLRP